MNKLTVPTLSPLKFLISFGLSWSSVLYKMIYFRVHQLSQVVVSFYFIYLLYDVLEDGV